MTTSKPKRRFLRFALRALLVFVLLSVPLGSKATRYGVQFGV